jgi:hypothetical protein
VTNTLFSRRSAIVALVVAFISVVIVDLAMSLRGCGIGPNSNFLGAALFAFVYFWYVPAATMVISTILGGFAKVRPRTIAAIFVVLTIAGGIYAFVGTAPSVGGCLMDL